MSKNSIMSGSFRQPYGPPPPAQGISRLWSWIPRSWSCRLFLLITLGEAAVNISIEGVLLARYRLHKQITTGTASVLEGAKSQALPVFVMVFAIAHAYQMLLAIDAVVNRNTILVISLLVFNLCFLVYSVIQIQEIRDVLGDGVLEGSAQTVPVQILTGAIPIVIGVAEIAFIILGWQMWKEFGWQIYKKIGADRGLKRAYLHYQIFLALLKFDFFIFIAFCIQLILVVQQIGLAERIITMVSAPFTLIILCFAMWSVRQELRWGMSLFTVGLAGAMTYFSYKLIRIWQGRTGLYQEVYKSLTTFSVLAILMILVTVAMTIRCTRNFDRGLKNAIGRHSREKQMARQQGLIVGYDGKALTPLGDGSTSVLHLQPRLSID
ncbi:uncharacterized protein PFL1_03551 [Pseudozyma flocculosa PF-1]|uniref:Uncharacterized protein n=2 Tax=Pseudozyma flocculosa TaxID=84751 RepID=A0A5C3F824_9BASI|nr:uncharacterized protein PFL1_03551 [Pseudozyma flocculosa PF-1]EPQ28748.1 hypothetical protein PFL1_03551 [Pseudozyma flocculosa PF-1]SPO39481.1 uncharacterized protein PSFLO_04962 [Pseudozyma flocculosa]